MVAYSSQLLCNMEFPYHQLMRSSAPVPGRGDEGREILLNHQYEQVIIEKLRALPPAQVAEVENFVDFLHSRSEARALTGAAAKLAENSFSHVWDNESDAEYDRL